MPDEGTVQGTQTGNGTGDVPAWVAQLPQELRDNQTFHSFKTIGDLAKSHLDQGGKLQEFDGLKTKLSNSIPKLTESATDEEKNVYFLSLGRPEKADGYEFEGDGLDEKAVTWARDAFFKAGLSKDQAKAISGSFNGYIKGIVDAEIAQRETERTDAEAKLKTELGDKYDASVELVRRVWKKHTNSEFDAFVNESKIGNDPRFIRFMLNIAKLTGEDTSPAGNPEGQEKKGRLFPNSPGLYEK